MDLLCCPVCHQPLQRQPHRYCCAGGHSFDIARQGYVNLLQSQRSSARTHGDDKEMVLARTAFLEQGYYEPLRRALAERAQFYTGDQEAVIVDAGCGEGWYTQAVAAACPRARVIGLDISKDALKQAGKRPGFAHLAVASCFEMPLADGTVDCVLNIFSPLADREYCRILKPRGVLLRVVPDLYHLWELKEQVYDTPKPNRPEPTDLQGLKMVEQIPLHYSVTLPDSTAIQTLFRMTPYCHRTSFEDRCKLEQLQTLTTRVQFTLLVYQKQ